METRRWLINASKPESGHKATDDDPAKYRDGDGFKAPVSILRYCSLRPFFFLSTSCARRQRPSCFSKDGRQRQEPGSCGAKGRMDRQHPPELFRVKTGSLRPDSPVESRNSESEQDSSRPEDRSSGPGRFGTFRLDPRPAGKSPPRRSCTGSGRRLHQPDHPVRNEREPRGSPSGLSSHSQAESGNPGF